MLRRIRAEQRGGGARPQAAAPSAAALGAALGQAREKELGMGKEGRTPPTPYPCKSPSPVAPDAHPGYHLASLGSGAEIRRTFIECLLCARLNAKCFVSYSLI